MKLNEDSVVLVTGASRGVGKGIAMALANSGATVYVTARAREEGNAALPGTLEETVEAINARGGKGVGVVCDHSNDEQIKALFQRIRLDHDRLDILANNVYKVPDTLMEPGSFWEKPLSYWDDMIDIGLRSHYVASWLAAPMMISRQSGLIVNISSFGARCFIHTPAYGIGKAGMDKMAHDMAKELSSHNVAMLSLWLGIVRTERTSTVMDAAPEMYESLAAGIESPEYPGRIIRGLCDSGDVMQWSGKTYITAELGKQLNIRDIDGKIPSSYAPMLGEPVQPSEAMVR